MKLLTRTSLSYIIVSGIVFIISGLIIFNLLQSIFRRQIDETLNEEKLLIEQTINFADSVPDFRLVFGHMIDVTILNSPQPKYGFIKDTLMYDSDLGAFASFRHLLAENTSFRKKGYIINIYKPLRDSERLMAEIVIVLSLVFFSLLLMLVLVNYFITRRVWIPSYRTMENLSAYDINQEKPVDLSSSAIYEFNLLNEAIGKMSRKIRLDYLNLKEFSDNAAHEMQTPLAVIKSKLELLIQDEKLDENQLRQISAVFEATTRMSKLTQGLLLISKIDNNQFPGKEKIDLPGLLDQVIEHFAEITEHRQITLIKNYEHPASILMHPALAEILITNLVSNAIRHNINHGRIEVTIRNNELTIINTGLQDRSDPGDMFQRFRKSDHHPESVGLGLSIVRQILNHYQMQISYTNQDALHKIVVNFS